MNRVCFFCDVEVERFSSQVWELPGIGAAEIGFVICTGCGMVLQSPSVSPGEVARYYNETAVYNNPGRAGRPATDKIAGVANQLRLIKEAGVSMTGSVFQVGCSDGYTLSRMREAGASNVSGIDPGAASNKLAASLYGLRTIVGTFEDFEPDCKYDLVVMTHILEHFFDPVEAVRKASTMQDDGGWILIEVPLLERAEALPPGYFTFEHLNYFSESTLKRLLDGAGYAVRLTRKLFDLYDYPAIAVVARKEAVESIERGSDFDSARRIVDSYISQEDSVFAAVEARVRQGLEPGTEVYIWGAGVHTAQLFARTALKSYLKVRGLLDSSPARWGKSLGGLMCFDPGEVELGPRDTIVISSYASEAEIYDALLPLRACGVSVVRLYHDEAGACIVNN